MKLFDEASLRRLEQLALVAERVRAGQLKGDRRSSRRGTSIEFADYREYAPGDDLRRLDWNVLARLERPFMKLTEEEEDLAVHVLVDVSPSMNWPLLEPSPESEAMALATNKLWLALRLAGGLGHVALASGDLLTVTLLDGDNNRHWGPFRSQQNSWRLLEFLEAGAANTEHSSSATLRDLNLSLQTYARRARRPGLAFVLSDMLSPGGYARGLNALLQSGFEIAVIHILSPDEIEPALDGDLKLVDVETQAIVEVTVDAGLRRTYIERLAAWQDEIGAFCRQRRIHYIPVTTGVAWDTVLLDTMRRRGVVR